MQRELKHVRHYLFLSNQLNFHRGLRTLISLMLILGEGGRRKWRREEVNDGGKNRGKKGGRELAIKRKCRAGGKKKVKEKKMGSRESNYSV